MSNSSREECSTRVRRGIFRNGRKTKIITMKNLNKITFLAITVLSLTLASCNKDKEAPIITVNSPDEHSHHLWGEMVHFEVTITDDQGLKSYTIMMVDADGNHEPTIDYMSSSEISGVTYDLEDHFTVPEDAPMMAWLQITAVDMEGKTTEKQWMLHFDEE